MPRYFTRDHEWIEVDGPKARVGITDYAQSQLGDITYVDLPAVGATMARGDSVAVIDSVKAASDVYAPAGGTVTAVNAALEEAPELVNASAEADGWLWELDLADPVELDELLDAAAYTDFIAGL
ncbi:glycine cleavage system protein H [Novosphingobium nitrogenifigens DSM 19370]|uniref:Glycine cleavage system H protein n=1 Tax=Novosphingobium nitrogenifigens DSM 19370 TaxID=983920 RepID=F1ZA29_9SPHN|nr:glycine cleavage system protein GcvH [Novosphingobium nitrogenifigens]EGD58563.1 glycine cleavage system protein H [Novosphingobium nitrogenifigens DSM 19370]